MLVQGDRAGNRSFQEKKRRDGEGSDGKHASHGDVAVVDAIVVLDADVLVYINVRVVVGLL